MSLSNECEFEQWVWATHFIVDSWVTSTRLIPIAFGAKSASFHKREHLRTKKSSFDHDKRHDDERGWFEMMRNWWHQTKRIPSSYLHSTEVCWFFLKKGKFVWSTYSAIFRSPSLPRASHPQFSTSAWIIETPPVLLPLPLHTSIGNTPCRPRLFLRPKN